MKRSSLNTPRDIQEWFADKPSELAQVLAIRNSLRVFPLLLEAMAWKSHNQKYNLFNNLILQSFRSCFLAFAQLNYPNESLGTNLVAASQACSTISSEISANANEAWKDTSRDGEASSYFKFAYASGAIAQAAAFNVSGAVSSALEAVYWALALRDFRDTPNDKSGLLAKNAMRLLIQIDYDQLSDQKHPYEFLSRPLWMEDFTKDEQFYGNIYTWTKDSFEKFATDNKLPQVPRALISTWYAVFFSKSKSAQTVSAFGKHADLTIAGQPDSFWEVSDKRTVEVIWSELANLIRGVDNKGTWLDNISDLLEKNQRPFELHEIQEYLIDKNIFLSDAIVLLGLTEFVNKGQLIQKGENSFVHSGWIKAEDGDLRRLTDDIEEAVKNIEPQGVAAFRFGWREQKIEALKPADVASDSHGAQVFLDEARRKARHLAQRLEQTNSDRRVLTSVNGLIDVLVEDLNDLRPQLLRSRSRSIEADALAFADPLTEKQDLFPDAVSALIDLSETLRDLQGYFPQLRELEAELAALDLNPALVDQAKDHLDDIVEAASDREAIVGQSAIYALQTMEAIASERAAPTVKQKRVAEYALVVRNFVSAVVRFVLDTAFVCEARRLASDIYAKARPKVVEEVSDGIATMAKPATVLAVSALIGLFAGPVWGVTFAALGFARVDRLLKLAEKLIKDQNILQNQSISKTGSSVSKKRTGDDDDDDDDDDYDYDYDDDHK